MGLPPLWAEICSQPHGARIPIARLAREFCKARTEERRLAYSECHDHSLVGDQTLAFRLMGADMYQGNPNPNPNPDPDPDPSPNPSPSLTLTKG